MRRRCVGLLVCMMLVPVLAVPSGSSEPQEGDIVASGHIVVGAPLEAASLLLYGDPTSIEGPHTFTFDVADLEGLWLWTQVHDPTGAGFVVLLHYLDADGRYIETECAPAPGSTALATKPYGRLGVMAKCQVPPGAATGFVTGWYGALLDVTVVIATPPPPPPAPPVLAEGHIPLGAPYGQDSQWWLSGPASASIFSVRTNVTGLDGARILTEVTDQAGNGYDVRLTFRAANGAKLTADCVPMPGAEHPLFTQTAGLRWSESCVVPAGAVLLDAHAEYGMSLDVLLRLA